jgi:hypothetical protein
VIIVEENIVYLDSYGSKFLWGIRAILKKFKIVDGKNLYMMLSYDLETEKKNIGLVVVKRFCKWMQVTIGRKYIIVGRVLDYDVDLEEKIIEIEMEIDWEKSNWDVSKIKDIMVKDEL